MRRPPSDLAEQTTVSFRGHRFPRDVVSVGVWLSYRFPLSLRMVEEMLAARGIVVTYETVRRWALKFGQIYAQSIRRRHVVAGDKWHLDEMVVKIDCRRHWLRRAVDQHGMALGVLVQARRDKHAAKRLMRELLRKQGRAPRVMVTDRLRSYGAANDDMGLAFGHRRHKGLNNRAENSHQPMHCARKLCGDSKRLDSCSDLPLSMIPLPISS